ncbi:hypothetical protein GCM10010470_05750 [Saccharopolyspora taberi]|uniref:Uncharacterized protein n=1 Tax=Saccharopolyspora taberi TaxID=60895 RepID=A0ABN3V2Q7_9PSEU
MVTDAFERAQAAGVLRPMPADVVRDLVFGPPVHHWLLTGEVGAESAVEWAIRSLRP